MLQQGKTLRPVKNIVIVQEDGIIQGVYCPDDDSNYEIHILDNAEKTVDSATLQNYFEDVAQIVPNLVNCY